MAVSFHRQNRRAVYRPVATARPGPRSRDHQGDHTQRDARPRISRDRKELVLRHVFLASCVLGAASGANPRHAGRGSQRKLHDSLKSDTLSPQVFSYPEVPSAGLVSRRKFFGGVAATVGAMSFDVSSGALRASPGTQATATTQRFRRRECGLRPASPSSRATRTTGVRPSPCMKAMNGAWKYANRYGYPDGDIVAGDRRAPRREAREHPAHRRLRRSARRGRHDVPAERQEGARRRAVLRLGLPARDEHQGRGDQAAAAQGLSPGHPGDDRRGQQATPRRRVRLPLQPEQPDRRRRDREGSEAGRSTASRRTCRS